MALLRSRLALFSIIAFLVGLQVSTGALGYAAKEFVAGWDAFLNPNVPEEPLRMVGGTGLMLLGGLGMGVSLWVWVTLRSVALSNRCPRCGAETKRVHRRLRDRFLARLSGYDVNRRRCSHCTWKGLAYKA